MVLTWSLHRAPVLRIPSRVLTWPLHRAPVLRIPSRVLTWPLHRAPVNRIPSMVLTWPLHRGPTAPIVSIHKWWVSAISNAAALIHYSRAFDKVWRDALLMKMSQKDIPSHMVRWVQAWLSVGLAWVKFDGVRSYFSRSWFFNRCYQGHTTQHHSHAEVSSNAWNKSKKSDSHSRIPPAHVEDKLEIEN